MLPLFFNKKLTSENYHPNNCTVNTYKFAFLWDNNSQNYKIHGLWPDECDQCVTCGYPTCCNTNLNYTIITNNSFIDKWWYDNDEQGVTCGSKTTHLFEHEVLKHGSCVGIGLNNEEYLNLVEDLFYNYYNYTDTYCKNNEENCYLNLNKNIELDEKLYEKNNYDDDSDSNDENII